MSSDCILLILLELVSLALILRLWINARLKIVTKIVYTMMLLVPLIGPVFYMLIANNVKYDGTDPTGEYPEPSSDSPSSSDHHSN